MRQKRAKAYRKLMSLYCMSFGFRQPYQVLVDSEMCKASISQKLEFAKQVETVLQGTVKLMITQCCIHELYLQGKAQQPAVDLAKAFERRKCNHREAIPGDDCLASVVGETNKHRYVIATQSHDLRVKLRTIPAVPLIHINRSVMILEPPSEATVEAKESAEEQLLHPSAPEIAAMSSTNAPAEAPKKKKGLKGPNPLSVKKKKPKPEYPMPKNDTKEGEQGKAGTKRKRDADEERDAGEHQPLQRSGRKRKRHRKTSDKAVDSEVDEGV
ncbi:Fcf1-domain-containing protein [Daedalea quercina L-15889]|uniref:U three protein 23 n=1 Tax=Daedalea quercina L-15889 TaxID=1314783 RepID=A0A165UC13_9APHY|nr:Fcf1-domain-containing protein [Daedalea quercina L-15889]